MSKESKDCEHCGASPECERCWHCGCCKNCGKAVYPYHPYYPVYPQPPYYPNPWQPTWDLTTMPKITKDEGGTTYTCPAADSTSGNVETGEINSGVTNG